MAKEWAKKFYNSKAWKKCRQAHLAKINYLCERCSVVGVIKVGDILHHKTKLTPENINNPRITLNEKNLEFLCITCHNIDEHGEHKKKKQEAPRCYIDDDGKVHPPIKNDRGEF